MLKKVSLTDTHTGRTQHVIVDTDDDELALFGAGKSPNETVKIQNITGADEFIQRNTWKKPSLEDRLALFGGLGRCLERNISILKSLELQTGRVKSPVYRGVLAEIARQIGMGEKFSDALGLFPKLFPDDVLALVRAGEESGQLPVVCNQIANAQQKTLRIIKKLRTGMIYPAIVLVIAVGVVIAMSFTLVPAIAKLYTNMKAGLPFATIAMMWFSDLLLHRPYLAALPFVGLFYFFKKWPQIYRIPSVQRGIIKLPTVGPIVRKSAATVSFRTLAMLIQSNVRIVTSLEITAAAASHIDYREFFLAIRNHIVEGMSLPEGFLMESYRLGTDGRMIATLMQIASETGGANETLDEIAADYEDELETIANQIDKILEPITLLVMGVFVGFLVYAIYGPIFNLSEVVLPHKKPVAGHVAPK